MTYDQLSAGPNWCGLREGRGGAERGAGGAEKGQEWR